MPKSYRILAEKYDQVNEISINPKYRPEPDKHLLLAKMAMWAIVTNFAKDGFLELPNGEQVDIEAIRIRLKEANTKEELEQIYNDYGLEYYNQ